MAYCWAMTEPLRPDPMMQLSYFLSKMLLLSLCLLEDTSLILEDVRRLLGVDGNGWLLYWVTM